jgi:hypothetical protein
MDDIVNFPLLGEFKREWDELIQYFPMLVKGVLEKISIVEEFTVLSLAVQVDAIVGNYLFKIKDIEYRLSFVMPIIKKGSYMSVNVYIETTFLKEHNFVSLTDFENNFAPWFENLDIFGGK